MTPQLMQAIKLLQLSNLDLVAFVEDELERNPLLERAGDNGEPPVRGEQTEGPVSSPSEFAKTGDGPDDFSGDGTTGFSSGEESSDYSSGDAAGDDWINRDLGTRSEMEQTFDTGLDNVFTEEPSEAAARNAQDAAPTAFTEWGGGSSNDDDYNLEAFVAAELSLRDHLAEQLAVALTDPRSA